MLLLGLESEEHESDEEVVVEELLFGASILRLISVSSIGDMIRMKECNNGMEWTKRVLVVWVYI